MSYKEKPILKLYKYENNTFVLQAIIDDFMECSFERNLYQAGNFTISINYNIPNAQLFQRGLFVQFGNDPYDFGEIISISDAISSDGKGSQIRTITGYDSRYILKRRVIKNMNSNGLWVMTGKGETVLRNLIYDQCGAGESETKRQLPIMNSIPAPADAIGKEYSVSEQFSNLYEVCKTIATQSEIGWRLKFDNSSLTLTLECYEGENRAQIVQFSTSFDSLANGQFTDSSDSYTNAIYVGGKGQNDNRDIYEGEDGTPSGLDRFESWDNQSNMTTEDEYEAEALAMLTQYGQTITVNGNGLAKCPYIYKEEYDVGDIITLAFSGKSAIVQILSVTEHWAFGQYSINFSFGKPQNNIQDQLQLILRKIQTASEKSQSTDSVRWYTIPTDTQMPKADVTYRTIGFIGNVGNGATFQLYLDNEKTGAKTYHIYFKQLAGSGKLTLTTGKEGASNLVLNAGTYVAIVYVDENGNVTSQGMTATSAVEAGNNQPVTSDGVNSAIQSATGGLVTGVKGNSETNYRTGNVNITKGNIGLGNVDNTSDANKPISTATQTALDGKQGVLTAGANIKINENNVIEGTSDLPTDAVLHYSFDEVPDYPDGTADVRLLKNWTSSYSNVWNVWNFTKSIIDNTLKLTTSGLASYGQIYSDYLSTSNIQNKIIKIKFKTTNTFTGVGIQDRGGEWTIRDVPVTKIGTNYYEVTYLVSFTVNYQQQLLFVFSDNTTTNFIIIEDLYIGDGSYSTPIIDNANGQYQTIQTKGFTATQCVSGKGIYFPAKKSGETRLKYPPARTDKDISISCWVKFDNSYTSNEWLGLILNGVGDYDCGLWRRTSTANSVNVGMIFRWETRNSTASVDIPKNEWHLLTGIYDANTRIAKIYVDGVYKSEGVSIINAGNQEIANRDYWSINEKSIFQGSVGTTTGASYYIDDVLFFNRALSEKEVLALYYNKANTPKYYNINNYNLKQIKDITAQSTDFADFQSRMAGLATRSLQLIEPTEDER